MKFTVGILLLFSVAAASGYRNLLQVVSNTQVNYNPVSVTVNSAPYTLLATPITPVLPYSQAAYQCNVTGDSRYPPYATGTFPLTVTVPAGQKVRVVFANGNLNGATVTQQGEPGVIVQQGGAVIVQQSGGASPIVQNVGSPVLQSTAPPSALVVQQSPTVVQQPTYPQSPVVQPLTPSNPTPSNPTPSNPTPNPTSPTTPAPTTPVPTTPAPTTPAPTTPAPTTPAPTTPAPTTPAPTTPAPTTPAPTTPAPTTPAPTTPAPTTTTPAATWAPTTPAAKDTPPATWAPTQWGAPTSKPTKWGNNKRRSLLQNTVPNGPNNGLVEYVGLISANSVPGFVVPNTQFGVPYVEYTASSANVGQTASFKGSLVVANVVGGVPQYPFTVNPSLSPFCQVNVNFKTA